MRARIQGPRCDSEGRRRRSGGGRRRDRGAHPDRDLRLRGDGYVRGRARRRVNSYSYPSSVNPEADIDRAELRLDGELVQVRVHLDAVSPAYHEVDTPISAARTDACRLLAARRPRRPSPTARARLHAPAIVRVSATPRRRGSTRRHVERPVAGPTARPRSRRVDRAPTRTRSAPAGRSTVIDSRRRRPVVYGRAPTTCTASSARFQSHFCTIDEAEKTRARHVPTAAGRTKAGPDCAADRGARDDPRLPSSGARGTARTTSPSTPPRRTSIDVGDPAWDARGDRRTTSPRSARRTRRPRGGLEWSTPVGSGPDITSHHGPPMSRRRSGSGTSTENAHLLHDRPDRGTSSRTTRAGSGRTSSSPRRSSAPATSTGWSRSRPASSAGRGRPPGRRARRRAEADRRTPGRHSGQPSVDAGRPSVSDGRPRSGRQLSGQRGEQMPHGTQFRFCEPL